MVRILGNSTERVPIKDLNDVIYYKQVKEYSDHEYETSIDLKRAIANGRLTKIEQAQAVRGTTENIVSENTGAVTIRQEGISKDDLKTAIREVMAEAGGRSSGVSSHDVAGAFRDIAPLIVDTIRQEVSNKLSGMNISGISTEKKSTYIDPTYIPDINMDGLAVSNIKTEEKQVSGADMNSALATLRNMNKNNV